MELHPRLSVLNEGLEWVRQAPRDQGAVRLLVRRPAIDAREILTEAQLDADLGLLGDNWHTRGSSAAEDGGPDPRAQITVTSWRAVSLVAGSEERAPLTGDQIHADLDLSLDNLPPGTLLHIGSAVLEVSDKPHTGCKKFGGRYGPDALRFVNLGAGRELRLRGINTRIAQAGTIRLGDVIRVERSQQKIA
jgi:MOSC domain-containing protein YiiM